MPKGAASLLWTGEWSLTVEIGNSIKDRTMDISLISKFPVISIGHFGLLVMYAARERIPLRFFSKPVDHFGKLMQ